MPKAFSTTPKDYDMKQDKMYFDVNQLHVVFVSVVRQPASFGMQSMTDK